jgi:hypothetical protein
MKEIAMSIYEAFRKRDQRKLRKLNDKILRNAVLEFSRKLYDLAVFSYVFSKIISKPRYVSKEMEKFLIPLENDLKQMAKSADDYSDEEWKVQAKIIEQDIAHLEGEDPRFIISLMQKGKLKVAATLYAQGISLGLASEMTGMNKQDILDYAGKTMMFDRVKEEKGILERVKALRKLVEK